MKKFILTIVLFSGVLVSFGQAPAAFNYQAVLRDASGNIRANANISVRIDIIKTSVTGNAVYSELFAATTNAFGIINLQVGKGAIITGTFAEIDWSSGPYFIKISVDNSEISTTQVLSVPFALYAAKAGNGFSGNYTDLTGKPALAVVATSGNYADLINKPSETDPLFGASVSKTIKASDTTRWSAKSNFSGNYNDLSNKPVILNEKLYSASLGLSALRRNEGNSNTAIGQLSMANNTTGRDNTALGFNSLLNNTTGLENLAIGSEALMNNTTGSDNVAIGYKALVGNTTGGGNTGVGVAALYSNTLGNYNSAFGGSALEANMSGNFNTAIGTSALWTNSSGSYNTGLGANSLFSNSTGTSNTAVGFFSLQRNSIGNHNTAMGDSALYFNRERSFNSAFGSSALKSNNTGQDNTAMGYWALRSNSSGNYNIAIGNFALNRNSSGSSNTAIGYAALSQNFSDGYNAAIGFEAMKNNSMGASNVAIGAYALNANTMGDYNTAVGRGAMTSNTTGSNNTALGYNANISDGISNATAIGNGALVNASNKIVLGNASAVTVGGYGIWVNYSDRRLKENIIYTTALGLNFISRLKPASYNYILDNNKHRRDGFIAQDVQQVLKELGIGFSGLVEDEDKDKTLNLSYDSFVVPLVTAVQELNEKNKSLELQLIELKAEIELIRKSLKTQ